MRAIDGATHKEERSILVGGKSHGVYERISTNKGCAKVRTMRERMEDQTVVTCFNSQSRFISLP